MKRLIFFIGIISSSSYAQNMTLAEAALERTYHKVRYDPAYVSIPYPNGDVPADTGVCTDVVIRSYRKLGIDLQKEVHEDISGHFQAYPSKRIWGLSRPDKNIDHRRVPNLQAFFTRKGQSLSISNKAEDYLPGDIVTWMLPGNLPHIGIVTAKRSLKTNRYLVAHNIGAGPVLEDMLFSFKITGHYRYNASQATEKIE
ncbi:DUF1287 domain-containing protein [Microbulbifer sp. TRSA005]|uniref:DUF1287 domain-containing protein n=1 Tax=unclassified Microbulbifer TaxID=2619833 RepID=UPI00403A51E7